MFLRSRCLRWPSRPPGQDNIASVMRICAEHQPDSSFGSSEAGMIRHSKKAHHLDPKQPSKEKFRFRSLLMLCFLARQPPATVPHTKKDDSMYVAQGGAHVTAPRHPHTAEQTGSDQRTMPTSEITSAYATFSADCMVVGSPLMCIRTYGTRSSAT